MKNRIQYIEPQRDECGFWSHPEIPVMETSDEVKAWLNENNLEYNVQVWTTNSTVMIRHGLPILKTVIRIAHYGNQRLQLGMVGLWHG